MIKEGSYREPGKALNVRVNPDDADDVISQSAVNAGWLGAAMSLVCAVVPATYALGAWTSRDEGAAGVLEAGETD
ncbi:MAG: hypothetical protein FWG25_09255 [Promicromonosporaceae bacterium]|nr:hypothetical protein [Promicromonosporaceae bacterium]